MDRDAGTRPALTYVYCPMLRPFLVSLLSLCFWGSMAVSAVDRPQVFVFTDINIDRGDPDDRQSLIHLLWYADELRIQGVVPERWNAEGYKACELVIDAYRSDFHNLEWSRRGFPTPEHLRDRIATDWDDGLSDFTAAAEAASPEDPLYVLIWGAMTTFGAYLDQVPHLASHLRLVTIGTHVMFEEHLPHIPPNWPRADRPCEQPNWNGHGRQKIFDDPRFEQLWWVELNWTYEGMFTGEEPRDMFETLGGFGSLGKHMHEVVKNQAWARYFRVGDTPSVLYVIDSDHDRDDPTQSSWAGKFVRPFPELRPNYFADDPGPTAWDHADPCSTWSNHASVREHAKSTLERERPDMYRALLVKLTSLYPSSS